MSRQTRFRRGTTAQHSTFTGPAGEITMDTDKDVLVVHNGVTAGGVPIARADRPRGWTRTEFFTANGTWTQTGKTDLKRVIVTAYGGGAGGHSSGNAGGSQGGVGTVVLEVSALTTNVAVTIGAGGAANAAGGTTSFGTFISCTGGAASGSGTPGTPGSPSGTGVLNLGSQGGVTAGNSNVGGQGGGPGGGGGGTSIAGKGIFGSGGCGNASGSGGSIIIEEIYGFV